MTDTGIYSLYDEVGMVRSEHLEISTSEEKSGKRPERIFFDRQQGERYIR